MCCAILNICQQNSIREAILCYLQYELCMLCTTHSQLPFPEFCFFIKFCYFACIRQNMPIIWLFTHKKLHLRNLQHIFFVILRICGFECYVLRSNLFHENQNILEIYIFSLFKLFLILWDKTCFQKIVLYKLLKIVSCVFFKFDAYDVIHNLLNYMKFGRVSTTPQRNYSLQYILLLDVFCSTIWNLVE